MRSLNQHACDLVQVLDDTPFAIFVIMALMTMVLARPYMTALDYSMPTATTPETDRKDLKLSVLCKLN